MALKIYLAGPDVFLADARRVGRRKQELCREYGFEGLFPLDKDEAVGPDANHLIDVFSPPRFDFSAMEGWVFNADDYPAPVSR